MNKVRRLHVLALSGCGTKLIPAGRLPSLRLKLLLLYIVAMISELCTGYSSLEPDMYVYKPWANTHTELFAINKRTILQVNYGFIWFLFKYNYISLMIYCWYYECYCFILIIVQTIQKKSNYHISIQAYVELNELNSSSSNVSYQSKIWISIAVSTGR